jgi:hypothetical protein
MNNLGQIYRALGNVVPERQQEYLRKAYRYLWKGEEMHQEMLRTKSTDAMEKDNRYVYSSLAAFLDKDGCLDGALRILRLGMGTLRRSSTARSGFPGAPALAIPPMSLGIAMRTRCARG